MNSLNHYAYGSVCEAIYQHIAGLKCKEAGWKKAVIAPKPNFRLKQMDLSFNPPRGNYQVKWEILHNGSYKLDVVVPHGTTATIQLPDHKDNFMEKVSAGEYHYCYKPIVDYIHPFNEFTIIIDILGNEEANSILKNKLPKLYAKVSGEDQEYLRKTLTELSFLPMFGVNMDEVRKVGKLLSKITV